MVAVLALAAGMTMGNGGVTPPIPGSAQYLAEIEKYLAIEAVCGVGPTSRLVHGSTINESNNISGTGILIAPNMVLTAAHVIASRFVTPDDQLYFEYPTDSKMVDPVSGDPLLTVRFRVDPLGNIGDLQTGGSSYYQVPVKRVLFSNVVCPNGGPIPNNGSPREQDIAILILADTEFDVAPFNTGWINHITPSPVAPVDLHSQHIVSGVYAGYGPVPNLDLSSVTCCERGELRYVDFPSFGFVKARDICTTNFSRMNTGRYPPSIASSDPSFRVGNQSFPAGLIGVGDSGSPVFFETETGQYIAAGGVPGGGGPRDITDFYYSDSWNAMFNSAMNVYGYPDMLPTDSLDITTSAGTSGASYGSGNWRIDASDALAVAAGLASNSWSDWNGDGVVDSLDYSSYISDLESALNPYHSRPVFPLRTGMEDVDGDGRFNVNDVLLLESMIGSVSPKHLSHDYNGSGVIDSGDTALLSSVLSTRGQSPGGGQLGPLLFDHSILGDVNRDGSIDNDDISQIMAFELGGGFNNILSGDPLYDVVYDANLDDVIESFDAQLISSVVLPGDLGVLSGPPSVGMDIVPDWQRDIVDVKRYLSIVAYHIAFNPIPTEFNAHGAGVDLAKNTWDYGSVNDGPDTYRTSNTQIPTDSAGNVFVETDYAFVTKSDLKYVLESLRDRSFDAVITDELLDLWFLDYNSDGRVNIEDLRLIDDYFTSCDPCGSAFDWDYTGDGTYTASDTQGWLSVYTRNSPLNQGKLGDYNRSCSPTCVCSVHEFLPPTQNFAFCSDIAPATLCFDGTLPLTDVAADCQDLSDMRSAGISFLFESGFMYGDDDFVVQLDADLDGDMDFFDLREVMYLLQPGDINFDGFVTADDIVEFNSRFPAANGSTSTDPNYDIDLDIDRSGVINFFDISEIIDYFGSPTCN